MTAGLPAQRRSNAQGRDAPPSRAHGVSLVEMMVALAVGAIVLLGLAEILSNTSATYTREEDFARLQENGRIAASLLTEAIRPSRSTACKSLWLHEKQGTLTVKACDLQPGTCGVGNRAHYLEVDRPLGFDQSQGLDDKSNYDLPPGVAEAIAKHWVLGDVVVAWGINPDGIALNGKLGGEGDLNRINLTADPSNLFSVGDLALVSNCEYAHLFEITGLDADGKYVQHNAATISGDSANATDDLKASALYGGSALYNRDNSDPRAELYSLVYKVFYLCCVHDGELQNARGEVSKCRPTNSANPPADYRPALCVFDLQRGTNGQSQVLVPDIADMRVTYSVDSNGDGALDYRAEDTTGAIKTAKWVTDEGYWAGVRSASVELLLTTELEHGSATAARPARSDWPPNHGSGLDPDTLGYAYQADNRLYQRIRFEVALRPSTFWTVTK